MGVIRQSEGAQFWEDAGVKFDAHVDILVGRTAPAS